LVIPYRHVEFVPDLYKREWAELQDIFDNLGNGWSKYYKNKERSDEIRVLDGDEPSYNFYVNNGVFSGQTIRHLHWHFIPRVWRQDTAMELTEEFHKVKSTPEETQRLFIEILNSNK
jgi:diadenosine tetraphosphate (Ap4A) HIT family hydrolase